MNNDMYFIPMIARALSQSNPKLALKKALEEIMTLGANPGYENGYAQFQEFMELAKSHIEQDAAQIDSALQGVVQELIIDLVMDDPDTETADSQAIKDIIMSRTEWKMAYEQAIATSPFTESSQIFPKLILERNGELIANFDCHNLTETYQVSDVIPGNYTLKMSSGRLIWEGNLKKEWVLWFDAYPEQDLLLAAETEEKETQATREFSFLEGQVLLRVFPGIESGRLQIMVRG